LKGHIPNFIKILSAEAELFYTNGGRETDRQTDMTKLIVALRSFTNAHENQLERHTKYILALLQRPAC